MRRRRVRFGAGSGLPSYVTLMQEHGVARGTVAKAVRVLVDEGRVRIVPGRGAYVTGRG
jgi:DNA-binding GntR family transcriptional regulator